MDLDNLASYPDIGVIANTRFVDASDRCAKLITSAGISAGIHASLYCVEKLLDSQTMRSTASGWNLTSIKWLKPKKKAAA